MEEADQCQTYAIEERDTSVLQEADQYLAGVLDREAAAAATQEMPDVMADTQAGGGPICGVASDVVADLQAALLAATAHILQGCLSFPHDCNLRGRHSVCHGPCQNSCLRLV